MPARIPSFTGRALPGSCLSRTTGSQSGFPLWARSCNILHRLASARRGWHAARLALTWPNRLVRCYRFCCARAMGEWSPPINQQEEIGREATVETPSAQTRAEYTGRPGALSHFFRISRDGWKSKFKDLEPGMVQLRVTAIPEVAIHWSSGFSRFT